MDLGHWAYGGQGREIMRSIVTLLLNVSFLLAYDIYVYLRSEGMFTDKFMQKAFMYSLILAFTAPLMVMGNSNRKDNIEVELRKVSQLTYILVILTIIINQFGFFTNPIHSVMLFNGINLVLLAIVGINLYRYGFFKRR